jgi:hypothetical protein
MSDRGLTHIARPVSDLDKSLEFYSKYLNVKIFPSRKSENSGIRVAWISDRTRPFVIVLIEMGAVERVSYGKEVALAVMKAPAREDSS